MKDKKEVEIEGERLLASQFGLVAEIAIAQEQARNPHFLFVYGPEAQKAALEYSEKLIEETNALTRKLKVLYGNNK